MNAHISEELVWSQVVARAWCDENFMKRLLSDPQEVLAEHDLDMPSDTKVEVVLGDGVKVVNTDSVRRFVLPANPSQDFIEEDLVEGAVSYCACGGCGRCGGCGCRCRC
jgi:hypothetical protein